MMGMHTMAINFWNGNQGFIHLLDVTIDNINDVSVTNTADDLVYIQGVQGLVFQRCTLLSAFHRGIRLYNDEFIWMTDFDVESAGWSSAYFDTCSQIQVSASRFAVGATAGGASGEADLKLVGTTFAKFTSCEIGSVVGTGNYPLMIGSSGATQSSNISFTGCSFDTALTNSVLIANTSTYITINGCQFDSSGSGTNIKEADTPSLNTFVNNDTPKGITIIGAGTIARSNQGFNPVGKITNPIGTGTIGLAGSGTSVTSTTIYTVTGVDCYITSTGGTVTNIVLKDPSGNIMETGATTLSYVHLPIGYSVTWTDSLAPTVTVFGN
jgi:hypothetical protein